MHPIRSFVVRIYRQDRRSIAGHVQDVRSGKSAYFQSFSDLWDALTMRTRLRANPPGERVETDPESASADEEQT